MSDALTIAANGLRDSAYSFASDAVKTVRAANGNAVDDAALTKAVTAQVTDTAAFKADAALFRTADKMRGTLLDTVA